MITKKQEETYTKVKEIKAPPPPQKKNVNIERHHVMLDRKTKIQRVSSHATDVPAWVFNYSAKSSSQIWENMARNESSILQENGGTGASALNGKKWPFEITLRHILICRERERESASSTMTSQTRRILHCEQHAREIGKVIANISRVTVQCELLLPVHSRHGCHRVRKRERGLQTWVHQNRANLCGCGCDFCAAPRKLRESFEAPSCAIALSSRIATAGRLSLRCFLWGDDPHCRNSLRYLVCSEISLANGDAWFWCTQSQTVLRRDAKRDEVEESLQSAAVPRISSCIFHVAMPGH